MLSVNIANLLICNLYMESRKCNICLESVNNKRITVADPGFPQSGSTNPLGGCQHMILPKFPKKCMKLKEFGSQGGHTSLISPLYRPMDYVCKYLYCEPLKKQLLLREIRGQEIADKWNLVVLQFM